MSQWSIEAIHLTLGYRFLWNLINTKTTSAGSSPDIHHEYSGTGYTVSHILHLPFYAKELQLGNVNDLEQNENLREENILC